jgi:hypothetical protein
MAIRKKFSSVWNSTSLVVVFAAIALLSFAASDASSDDKPRELSWQDLIPPPVEYDNPFQKMTTDELNDFTNVVVMRRLLAGKTGIMSQQRIAELKSLEDKFTKSGKDIEFLIAESERVLEAQRIQTESVIGSLNGEKVRMPGYILPLEFDGTNVQEFLLVPYVGACIHAPPPPANQIIHVKSDEGFTSEGLFQAVWVTGEMSAVPTKQSLYLVDGSSDISVGYGLQASSIKPYRN